MRLFTVIPSAAIAIATAATAEARSYGRLAVSPHHPSQQGRVYQYSRPRDGLDVVSDILLSPLLSWHNDANSLLRQHASSLLSSANPTSPAQDDKECVSDGPCLVQQAQQVVTPPYAISENSKTGFMELSMDLPGVAAKDLTIEIENDSLLRISGTRTHKKANGETVKTYQFDQTFQLDSDVDPERLEITLSHGVLSISAPKKAKVVKRLAVKTVDMDDEHNHLETTKAIDAAVDATEEELVDLDDKQN